MDRVCRAYAHALPAKFTLAEVDVSQVVVQGNCLERTFFDAFSTTDAGNRTSFAGDVSLVFVHATHENPAIFGTLVSQFDNVSRASFDASTAGNTIFFGNNGQTVGVI